LSRIDGPGAEPGRKRLLLAAAEAAGNAALLAQHQYASGLVDFQTVLDTQRTLLTAQDGVAGTVASASTNHVRLYKALGGGWQAPREAGPQGQEP